MITKLLIFGVITYKKLISPLLSNSCRHYPSCSDYAIQALENHGPIFGSIMAIKRVLRCNPLFKGGYDPVND